MKTRTCGFGSVLFFVLLLLLLLLLVPSLSRSTKSPPASPNSPPASANSPPASAKARPADPNAPPAPQSELPLFPWPPPQASATEVIPRRLLEAKAGSTRLRDVDERIVYALEQNGYYERSYYAVPEGFALVTKMEQIESDGTPKQEPQRWILTPQPLVKFSLTAYFAALVKGTPGYYRVIAFIVTPYAFAQSTKRVTLQEAEAWISPGSNRLPDSIGKLDFSREGYACTALVYEFERAAEAEPSIQLPGRILGRTHLVKAGIWEVLQP